MVFGLFEPALSLRPWKLLFLLDFGHRVGAQFPIVLTPGRDIILVMSFSPNTSASIYLYTRELPWLSRYHEVLLVSKW